MTTITTVTGTRVRIVNDITCQTAIIETNLDRALVFYELVKIVSKTNHRKDDTVRASVHLLQDMVILHWHCPWIIAHHMAAEILEISDPIHAVEDVLREGGPQV